MEGRINGESFVIAWEDNKTNSVSLQNAFLKFKKERQEEIRAQKCWEIQKRSAINSDKLRKKFVDTALSYIGVPYARRYHGVDSPYYNAPLYLDCCGLVRRVLLDLKEDFGFTIGPWNQAYMYDTLPTKFDDTSDMKPGDLVFVSAIYNNPKSKQQKHNMVHVEIWLGDGNKTLGARWQKGVVEIHDSYRYVSKSYHSMEYHFLSIDTWLNGICKSHCAEHPWKHKQRIMPGKKSIFSQHREEEEEADPKEQDETEEQNEIVEQDDEIPEEYLPCDPINKPDESSQDQSSSTSSDDSLSVTGAAASNTSKMNGGSLAATVTVNNVKSCRSHVLTRVPSNITKRSYHISGHNGDTILQRICIAHGWILLDDVKSDQFFFKWTELRKFIDYSKFREGQQIVNHYPNMSLLTTKIGLLESLREHYRITSRIFTHRKINTIGDFFPQTYRLDSTAECEEFFQNFKEGEVWICKPNAANQGKGIFLVKDLTTLKSQLLLDQKNCKTTRRPIARIIQRYISNPLLLEQRKFDIRAYLLIVSAQPYLVLCHHGYVRLSCLPYHGDSDELGVHLTNQYIQKRNPNFKEIETIWSMEQLQHYIDTHLPHLPSNWVKSHLLPAMWSIMATCFLTVKDKLDNKLGFFELLGFDFMLDDSLKLWLIETNINPALHTPSPTLQQVIPSMLQEAVDIVVECFEKCFKKKQLLPLTSIRNFILLQSK